MPRLSRGVPTYNVSLGLVCRSCRLQCRQFATTIAPPVPTLSGITPLASRRLISVQGPDAAKFLQGIVTANITASDRMTRRGGIYTGFLNATGRVLYDVFVYPGQNASEAASKGDAFLVEVDADRAQMLAKHIQRYKLRAKLAVRLLAEGEATVWHAWDDCAKTNWDSITDPMSLITKDPRAPGLGYRLIRLDHRTPDVDLEQSTEDSYTIRRYLQGVAEGQDEIAHEQSLPLEYNMDIMNGIDFRKGCYVGQELTIRTKHRGVVRKRILPCVIYEPEQAPPQTLAYHPESPLLESVTAGMIPRDTSIGRYEKRGRSAGKWLKGVGNIGLGLCRLEIMTDVVLPGETASAVLTSDNEFVLDWGEEGSKSQVKVKAFVPDWLRQGLDVAQHH